ncbi:FMR1-interacting protein 1, conserved domain [Dillenia turbinata]|uniref:FMR1-interacting protein 1, conserved domain n=1 Tax=Dillenia turbinata TaxID=194707 RepID=A0AAN8VLZ4_9MAGN
MFPIFNGFANLPHQVQSGPNPGSATQQGMPSNPAVGTAGNALPNPMQIQSQMGSRAPMPNSTFMMNRSNHILPLQNGHVGIPSMSMPQNCMPNYNPLAVATYLPFGQIPMLQNVNQFNPSPQQGQFFPQNFNQNVGFPNANQFVPMQVLNPAQFVPNNAILCSQNMLQYTNQVIPNMVPVNPSFSGNQQMDVRIQASSSAPQSSNGSQPQPASENLSPSKKFKKAQGHLGKDGGMPLNNGNWNSNSNWNMGRNPNRKASSMGFQKFLSHQMQNAKGKYGLQGDHGGKGVINNEGRTKGPSNFANQNKFEKRRALFMNYTEEEVRQWREQRRKNYPSKGNIEKKLIEKQTESELTERDAKLRRQQLKEILAKQAEMGFEVAEVPSHYLSDSENQVREQEENRKTWAKKGRFSNKFNQRGRFDQNGQPAKKQRLLHKDSSDIPDAGTGKPKIDQNGHLSKQQRFGNRDSSTLSHKRETTLLQKLLSADIRRDKIRLLQVFRFMVMNDFFKDWPDKPLKYPLVMVKETNWEHEVAEQSCPGTAKASKQGTGTMAGDCEDDEDDCADDSYNEGDNHHFQEKAYVANTKGGIVVEIQKPEEEGEIVV